MTLSIREKIFHTADELLRETGRTPSIRQILEKTKGSSTTVQKYLKEWQEEQALRAQQPGFPLPVQRALGDAWDQLVGAAKQVFDDERQGYETRVQALEAEILALKQQLAEAQADAKEREMEVAELEHLNSEETRQRREAELESDGLRGQLALSRQAVETLTRQVEEQRETHRHTMDDLKAAHSQEIARLQEAVERSEDHLLRQIDEGRRQIEHLKAKQVTEISGLTQRMDIEKSASHKQTEGLMLQLRELHVALTREQVERTHLEEKSFELSAELTETKRMLDEARALTREQVEWTHLEEKNCELSAELTETKRKLDEARALTLAANGANHQAQVAK